MPFDPGRPSAQIEKSALSVHALKLLPEVATIPVFIGIEGEGSTAVMVPMTWLGRMAEETGDHIAWAFAEPFQWARFSRTSPKLDVRRLSLAALQSMRDFERGPVYISEDGEPFAAIVPAHWFFETTSRTTCYGNPLDMGAAEAGAMFARIREQIDAMPDDGYKPCDWGTPRDTYLKFDRKQVEQEIAAYERSYRIKVHDLLPDRFRTGPDRLPRPFLLHLLDRQRNGALMPEDELRDFLPDYGVRVPIEDIMAIRGAFLGGPDRVKPQLAVIAGTDLEEENSGLPSP